MPLRRIMPVSNTFYNIRKGSLRIYSLPSVSPPEFVKLITASQCSLAIITHIWLIFTAVLNLLFTDGADTNITV
jgi:hypothetical protein